MSEFGVVAFCRGDLVITTATPYRTPAATAHAINHKASPSPPPPAAAFERNAHGDDSDPLDGGSIWTPPPLPPRSATPTIIHQRQAPEGRSCLSNCDSDGRLSSASDTEGGQDPSSRWQGSLRHDTFVLTPHRSTPRSPSCGPSNGALAAERLYQDASTRQTQRLVASQTAKQLDALREAKACTFTPSVNNTPRRNRRTEVSPRQEPNSGDRCVALYQESSARKERLVVRAAARFAAESPQTPRITRMAAEQALVARRMTTEAVDVQVSRDGCNAAEAAAVPEADKAACDRNSDKRVVAVGRHADPLRSAVLTVAEDARRWEEMRRECLAARQLDHEREVEASMRAVPRICPRSAELDNQRSRSPPAVKQGGGGGGATPRIHNPPRPASRCRELYAAAVAQAERQREVKRVADVHAVRESDVRRHVKSSAMHYDGARRTSPSSSASTVAVIDLDAPEGTFERLYDTAARRRQQDLWSALCQRERLDG